MFLIGRRCLNEIFVMNLVQYVKFVSGTAKVCEVRGAIGATHRIGATVRYRTEVIIQV